MLGSSSLCSPRGVLGRGLLLFRLWLSTGGLIRVLTIALLPAIHRALPPPPCFLKSEVDTFIERLQKAIVEFKRNGAGEGTADTA